MFPVFLAFFRRPRSADESANTVDQLRAAVTEVARTLDAEPALRQRLNVELLTDTSAWGAAALQDERPVKYATFASYLPNAGLSPSAVEQHVPQSAREFIAASGMNDAPKPSYGGNTFPEALRQLPDTLAEAKTLPPFAAPSAPETASTADGMLPPAAEAPHAPAPWETPSQR